jgi:methyl-accepting chemotaxis protein
MERLTQTTAATAEESAAASEELSAQAQTTRDIATELGDLVGVKTRDNGPTAVAAGARTRANVVPMRTAAPATRVAPAAQPRAVTASDDTGTFGRF